MLYVKNFSTSVETDVLGQVLWLLPLTITVVIPCWTKEKGKEERGRMPHATHHSIPHIPTKGKSIKHTYRYQDTLYYLLSVPTMSNCSFSYE